MRALLVGVGNAFRGDDAIGLEVVRRAASQVPDGVEVLEVADPASLVDAWDGADRVVVVDAMVSRREPGTVVTIDVTDTPLPADGWASGGTHALGLAAAVELARALGRLPGRLVVVGIEAAGTGPGDTLSPEVMAAAPRAVSAAVAALVGDPAAG